MSGRHGQDAPLHWPYTIDDARQLVDETFGARLASERRDAIVRMLDRSARAAWQKSVSATFELRRGPE
jgi:hypothetical protein